MPGNNGVGYSTSPYEVDKGVLRADIEDWNVKYVHLPCLVDAAILLLLQDTSTLLCLCRC